MLAHEQIRQLPLQMQQQARGSEKSPANSASGRGKAAVGHKYPQISENNEIFVRHSGMEFILRIEGSILDTSYEI